MAYRALKSWILSGQIPLGMRFAEERIADRLSVSRTPVREALLRLHAEGFLERHRDGGFRIDHPTGRTVRELYDVRRALELFAVGSLVASRDARGAGRGSRRCAASGEGALDRRRSRSTRTSSSSTRTSTAASPTPPATARSSMRCAM